MYMLVKIAARGGFLLRSAPWVFTPYQRNFQAPSIRSIKLQLTYKLTKNQEQVGFEPTRQQPNCHPGIDLQRLRPLGHRSTSTNAHFLLILRKRVAFVTDYEAGNFSEYDIGSTTPTITPLHGQHCVSDFLCTTFRHLAFISCPHDIYFNHV